MRLRLPLVALCLWPLSASGANGLRPRTPVVFAEAACMETVTRGDVLQVDYSVPFDDVDLTPDELPDSRTQQFFAFAQPHFNFTPPTFINQADFDRAEANGDLTKTFGPDDILDTSSLWPAGTWTRITPDDARVPITAAQAAMGVAWDTSDAAPGTWLVYGYTWEPDNNLWSLRLGAVRIEDPADPEAAGPSLFVEPSSSPVATRGEPLAVPGCIVAPPGSTLTASWGDIIGIDEPTWVEFATDVPVETGPLMLDFDAPNEAGDSVRLRLQITDPAGRTYVTFSPTILGVVGDPVEGDDGGGGCRCGSPSRPAPLLAGFLGLLLVARRRRD
jgi:hypothetical protein